jgi:hypothetical protein
MLQLDRCVAELAERLARRLVVVRVRRVSQFSPRIRVGAPSFTGRGNLRLKVRDGLRGVLDW